MRILMAGLLMTVFALPATVTHAQAASKAPKQEQTAVETIAKTVFTELEKEIIRDYYGTDKHAGKHGNKKMPPGLAKRDSLPPGLAMQLEKNGTLPPGLAKRDLPNDLEDLLPGRKGGLKRILVDNDVVLIEEATERILDIIIDAAN